MMHDREILVHTMKRRAGVVTILTGIEGKATNDLFDGFSIDRNDFCADVEPAVLLIHNSEIFMKSRQKRKAGTAITEGLTADLLRGEKTGVAILHLCHQRKSQSEEILARKILFQAKFHSGEVVFHGNFLLVEPKIWMLLLEQILYEYELFFHLLNTQQAVDFIIIC